MTNSTKRKISAREILADIRAGMTDSQLEFKHNISNSSLKMVYRKLVAAGVLKEDELPSAERDTKADSPESFQTGDVYCPSCKSVRAPGATECSICGVVFEKLAALQSDKDPQPIMISSRQLPSVPHLRSISIVIVVCVLMVVLFVIWWGEITKGERCKQDWDYTQNSEEERPAVSNRLAEQKVKASICPEPKISLLPIVGKS